MPRFLPKLPKDEREEARLWVVMGDGLIDFLGEVVRVRLGDLVPALGGGDGSPDVERRCCSSGGCCCSSLTSMTDEDFCSSCSMTDL